MVSWTYPYICVFVFSSCIQILLSLFLSITLSFCVFLFFICRACIKYIFLIFNIFYLFILIYLSLYTYIRISFSIFIIHVHVFSVFIQVYLITRCNIFSVYVLNKNLFPGLCFDFVYLTTSTTYIFHTFLNDTKATITCLCSHLNNQLGYIIVHTHTKCLRNSMQHSVMVASIYYYVTYKACTNNLWKKKPTTKSKASCGTCRSLNTLAGVHNIL